MGGSNRRRQQRSNVTRTTDESGRTVQRIAPKPAWRETFDSWGGIIAGADYEAASLRWIRRIIAALPANFPVILYAKGTAPHVADQAFSGARVLSVDWTNDLAIVRRLLAGDHAEDRGLAGAVGADQTGLFTGIELERSLDEEDLLAVLLADVGETDHSLTG